jgi:hypothetical protein
MLDIENPKNQKIDSPSNKYIRMMDREYSGQEFGGPVLANS